MLALVYCASLLSCQMDKHSRLHRAFHRSLYMYFVDILVVSEEDKE